MTGTKPLAAKHAIEKDHKGLYLAPPFNHGKQVKIIPKEKDVMSVHLWRLWSEK